MGRFQNPFGKQPIKTRSIKRFLKIPTWGKTPGNAHSSWVVGRLFRKGKSTSTQTILSGDCLGVGGPPDRVARGQRFMCKEHKHFCPGVRPGGSVTGVTKSLFMCQMFMCHLAPRTAPTRRSFKENGYSRKMPLDSVHFNVVVSSNTLFSNTSVSTNSLHPRANFTVKKSPGPHLVSGASCLNKLRKRAWGPEIHGS